MSEEIDQKHELRIIIQYCVRRGLTVTETFNEMNSTYGEDIVTESTVKKWHKRFREERKSVNDDPRSGAPVSATTEATIEKAKKLIEDDPKMTLEDLANHLGISKGSAFSITSNHLDMQRICAVWIPHYLTTNQMNKRVEICLKCTKMRETNF